MTGTSMRTIRTRFLSDKGYCYSLPWLPGWKLSIYPAFESSICPYSTSVSCHLLFSDGGVPCGHNQDNTWRGWTLPGTAHHILRIASILWDRWFQLVKPEHPAEPNPGTRCSTENKRCSVHRHKARHRPVRYSCRRHNYSRIFESAHWLFSFAWVSFESTNCFSSQFCGCSLCEYFSMRFTTFHIENWFCEIYGL